MTNGYMQGLRRSDNREGSGNRESAMAAGTAASTAGQKGAPLALTNSNELQPRQQQHCPHRHHQQLQAHYNNPQNNNWQTASGINGNGNVWYYHHTNGGHGALPQKPRRSARLAGRRAPPPNAIDPRPRNMCPVLRGSRPLIAMTVNILGTYRRILDTYYAKLRAVAKNPPCTKSRAPTIPSQPNMVHNEYAIKEGDLIDQGGRYRVVRAVGQGSFGKVLEAVDTVTNETVAVKILPRNRASFLKQGRIEIRILESLNGKDPDDVYNIVRMKRHFEHEGHLCLVFEFLSNHLYEVLRSVKLAGLSLNLIRKFAWQILAALQFLCRPDVQILHCDLKPENILLAESRKVKIKVIDFGSSCSRDEKIHKYIQSRFYRAPEVLLGAQLSFGIDMWSLGCILVELFTGEPLFPGRNEHDQMCRMCDVLGPPPLHVIETADPEKVVQFFTLDAENSHRIIPTRLYKPRGKSLADILSANEEALNQPRTYAAAAAACAPKATTEDGELFRDLVARMLVYDPTQRITPSEALQHRFFPSTANTAVNTNLTGPRPPPDRSAQRSDASVMRTGRVMRASSAKAGVMAG